MDYRPFRFTSRDGLTLGGRDYGERTWKRMPVLCLAGLTRNAADFDALARHLAGHPEAPRRVLALDMRGRGVADHDPDPNNYDIAVEAMDALDGMVAAGMEEASIVGTSRGAILAMAIGAMRPAVMHALVMNDLGPVIDGAGLMQIKAYLSRMPAPKDWDDAGAILHRSQGRFFPDLTAEDWKERAHDLYAEEDGKLVLLHDPAIHRTLDEVGEGIAPPPMWRAFSGLRNVPILSIRGELSSLLSEKTQEEMARRHPNLQAIIVPREGHAPLLRDVATLKAIANFLIARDGAH